MFFVFYVMLADKPVAGFNDRQSADSLYSMLCKQVKGKVRVSLYARSSPDDSPLLLISNM